MSRCAILWIVFAGLLGCRPPAPLTSSDSNSQSTAGGGEERAKEPIAWRPPGKLVDLTHTYDESTVYWPTGEVFQLREDFKGFTDKGYYYTANTITTAEHGGTHIDAPIHFFKDRHTVDEIPLRQLIGEGVVIDVREKCAADRDYQIGVADLRAWEEKHGRQLVDVIVLLRTGFARFWPDRVKYMGTAKRGEEAVQDLHFPGLAPEAAKWLTEERAILAVGIDTPSIDYGQSTHFGSHVKLFEHNVPALENVNITDELPVEHFALIALPMKIGGGSGGPTRVVAVVGE